MRQITQKLSYDISKKIALGFLSLFAILLVSIILTISEINQPYISLGEAREHLFALASLQWLFLALAAIIFFLVVWWISRQQKQNILLQEMSAKIMAIDRSQEVIEFAMDGTIITANDNFLNTMGYTLDEIAGKDHNIFVDENYRNSQQYKDFWVKLNRGEYESGEYRCLAKDGREVWLQSTYNPILTLRGRPLKVVKYATDVTTRKMQDKELIIMAERLQEIGKQIIVDSSEISVGINQLEATAISQAASASEQATSVTEISATIEEIKVTSQQTLTKAKELGESANRTSDAGEQGREAIGRMYNSMQVLQEKMQQISSTILSLNDKTQQIGEITEAVADIAKQSKMLALNASIEAAKAGESGKGFAVVAGEVKELAEKSQQSTDRVQKILQDIRQTAERAVMVTEDGTKSVDENILQVKLTGDIISSLGEVIEESSIASMQIVSAVREESIAIDQVDLSVKEINKVTTLFSSATQQTKQAILGLAQVAQSLKNTASAYQINNKD